MGIIEIVIIYSVVSFYTVVSLMDAKNRADFFEDCMDIFSEETL